jgi:hypothetical protein
MQLFLALLAISSNASPQRLEISTRNVANASVESEILEMDGKLLAQGHPTSEASVVLELDSIPARLRLRWRSGMMPWSEQTLYPERELDGIEATETAKLLILHLRKGQVETFYTRQRRIVDSSNPTPARLLASDKFTAWPRISLRVGSPGILGIQAGLGGGLSSGNAESSTLFGPNLAGEADLEAPSIHAGLSMILMQGFFPIGFGGGTACRWKQWGSVNFEGCGGEAELRLGILLLRAAWMPRSDHTRLGLGLGF